MLRSRGSGQVGLSDVAPDGLHGGSLACVAVGDVDLDPTASTDWHGYATAVSRK